MEKKKLFLGETLVKEGLISNDQLGAALAEQKKSGELLGNLLIKMNIISEETLARFLSCHLGIDYADLTTIKIPPETIKLIPEDVARRFSAIPLEKQGNILVVALHNPQDSFAIDELRKKVGFELKPKITTSANIRYALEKYYGAKAQLRDILTSAKKEKPGREGLEIVQGPEEVGDISEDAPAVKLVNQLFIDAVKDGASDVHIEPEKEKVAVRFRIDGILQDIISPPKEMQESLISRIKVMANLDIAEKRMPQDGRINLNVEGAEIDVRVSLCPVNYGEKVVMRILNRSTISFGLKDLGFSEPDMALFEALIKRPYGIILVTGPTGSGKTTTLYSTLEAIKSRERNTVTIEDPIEYELEGIYQAQVNPKAGLNFAMLLRAFLRQDPDIMLVGEIRDLETGEVAIRAALTGHLVFSTLHTNDAPSSITRLIDMGIEPFLAASSTIGIIAQRLIRTICPKCKEQYTITAEVAKEMGLPLNSTLYRGKGCESCRNSGYKGRLGIYEILLVDDQIRDLITKRLPSSELKKLARQKGMRSLREDALNKALKGTTTLEEVVRVTEKD